MVPRLRSISPKPNGFDSGLRIKFIWDKVIIFCEFLRMFLQRHNVSP